MYCFSFQGITVRDLRGGGLGKVPILRIVLNKLGLHSSAYDSECFLHFTV